MNTNELTIEQEAIRDCPILYQMRYRPMDETCMCWGWEFNEQGWGNRVYETSCQLEALNNIFYPLFRTRIQADQIKEKYGTLHFYWSVVTDPSSFKTWLKKTVVSMSDFCFKADFKLKKVVEIEPFDYDEREEISKEEYEKELQCKCINVDFEINDGKIIRITHLRNFGKSHCVPTVHKVRYWFGNKLKEFSRLKFFWPKTDRKSTVASHLLYEIAEKIVHSAECDCEHICEDCGKTIGESWSPTCTTIGHITYICEDCAKKSKHDYYMNGRLMNNGKVLPSTAEEIKKEYEELNV